MQRSAMVAGWSAMSEAAPVPFAILEARLYATPIPATGAAWVLSLTVQSGPYLFAGISLGIADNGRTYVLSLPGSGHLRRCAITDRAHRDAMKSAAIAAYQGL